MTRVHRVGGAVTGDDRRHLGAFQKKVKAAGYDAGLPNRDAALHRADPERYDIGATCRCRGLDVPPEVIRLPLGGAGCCPHCGTYFHRLPDHSGFAIKIAKREALNRCNDCGENRVCEWAADPYAAEIQDDHTEAWRCASCLHESAMNV